jgi:hypothetical protein
LKLYDFGIASNNEIVIVCGVGLSPTDAVKAAKCLGRAIIWVKEVTPMSDLEGYNKYKRFKRK